MEQPNRRSWLAIILLFCLSALLFVLCIISEGTYDSGDGIRHYLVSRYSWQHPEQLLYHWGKPFFTLVSSPFSQFGLLGLDVFNILCFALSGWFCYKIVEKLKFSNPILVIPVLFFTPIYFPTLNSGLTEPLFGLVLIWSAYLMMQKRFIATAVLVSFLPFVRSEGFLLLPLFFFVLLFRKKFFHSLLLGTGTVLYSIIGGIYYKDFFWLKTQNPYTDKTYGIYGHGDAFYFFERYDQLFGLTLTILLIAGCIGSLYYFFGSRKKAKNIIADNDDFNPELFFLIFGSFLVYSMAHVVFWWKGLVGSLGLLRVIAAVIPASAIICLMGFNMFTGLVGKLNRIAAYLVGATIMFFVIINPFQQEYYPFKPDPEQIVIKETGDWFKTTPYRKERVFYLYPYLAHVLDVDCFDPEKVVELWSLYPIIEKWGLDAVPDSSIVFWDAHFGPNECSIQLDSIMKDPNFVLLKSFRPNEDRITLGGYKFEVHVFMKLKPASNITIKNEFFNFENAVESLENFRPLDTNEAYSGNTVSEVKANDEFSVTVTQDAGSLPPNTYEILFNSKFLMKSDKGPESQVVFSIQNNEGKNLHWISSPLTVTDLGKDTLWKTVSTHFRVPLELLRTGNKMKCYIWNRTGEEFFLDDLQISYQYSMKK